MYLSIVALVGMTVQGQNSPAHQNVSFNLALIILMFGGIDRLRLSINLSSINPLI
jgi:hypothetical protein